MRSGSSLSCVLVARRGKRRRDDDDQAEWEAAIRAAENGGEAPPQNTEDAAQGKAETDGGTGYERMGCRVKGMA